MRLWLKRIPRRHINPNNVWEKRKEKKGKKKEKKKDEGVTGTSKPKLVMMMKRENDDIFRDFSHFQKK